MDNAKELDLIRKGIEGLLDDIQHGRDPWLDHRDLADECHITDENVFEWIYQHRGHELNLLTMNGAHTDEFVNLIKGVMESGWYEELYQKHITQARDGIMEDLDWERTKKTLMPGRI